MKTNFPKINICVIVGLFDILLVNMGFTLAFLLRYGYPLPSRNFAAYKSSFLFLTAIYLVCLLGCGVYKHRFHSSWQLFKRVAAGAFAGTLVCVAFMYIFRTELGAFPSSVFAISFFVNLILIFKVNQYILKKFKRIKKIIAIIGEGDINEVLIQRSEINPVPVNNTKEILNLRDIDEIVIFEQPNEEKMQFITYAAQQFNALIVYSPACYAKILWDGLNGNGQNHSSFDTFVGRKRDYNEFAIRAFDITASLIILILSTPLILLSFLLIKISSKGPLIYKQTRVGKHGRSFVLYKLRTMVQSAETKTGPVLATKNDNRITNIGRLLRATRMDELPQLINVIFGDMSLVGPRPERYFFIKRHKALGGIRLAVKPGLTGLAQVRNTYDLNPKHKVKYDYLYIQRRSLLLNLYIVLKTIPVVLSKKGQ